MQFFACPAGATGGERNHKTMKEVFNEKRARMGSRKIQAQTHIAFNSKALLREPIGKRNTGFRRFLAEEWLVQAAGDATDLASFSA